MALCTCLAGDETYKDRVKGPYPKSSTEPALNMEEGKGPKASKGKFRITAGPLSQNEMPANTHKAVHPCPGGGGCRRDTFPTTCPLDHPPGFLGSDLETQLNVPP